jgi:hypothetical protein
MIVQATVIIFVNYDYKMFIVQVTGDQKSSTNLAFPFMREIQNMKTVG